MLRHTVTSISGTGVVLGDLKCIFRANQLKVQAIRSCDIGNERWWGSWQRIVVLDSRESSSRALDVLPALKAINGSLPIIVVASEAERAFTLLSIARLDGAEGIWFSESGTAAHLLQLLEEADRKLTRWETHLEQAQRKN